MKTSEFIKEVEKLEVDISTEQKSGFIYIKKPKNIIAAVSEFEMFRIEIRQIETFLGNIKSKQLFNLLTKYAATPIAERKDKTIEEKAREYIKEYVSDHLSFESARDFLECCNLYIADNGDFKNRIMHSYEEIAEYSKIYDWYHQHSTEFIRIWLEVSECE